MNIQITAIQVTGTMSHTTEIREHLGYENRWIHVTMIIVSSVTSVRVTIIQAHETIMSNVIGYLYNDDTSTWITMSNVIEYLYISSIWTWNNSLQRNNICVTGVHEYTNNCNPCKVKLEVTLSSVNQVTVTILWWNHKYNCVSVYPYLLYRLQYY